MVSRRDVVEQVEALRWALVSFDERLGRLERRLDRPDAGGRAQRETGSREAIRATDETPSTAPRLLRTGERLGEILARKTPSATTQDEALVRAEGGAGARSSATAEIERWIGAKAFTALGAIVVVVGVGLFLKLAYDQGWLRLLSPAAKCGWSAAFGVALLLAGEIARKRISALASAGLSAAGLGAIYAAAFASHGVYSLVGARTALALLAGAAAIGLFVGVRSRIVLVTALATVGAYLAPILLAKAPAQAHTVPAYLLGVLCVAVAVAGSLGRWFGLVRVIAWAGTMGLGMWWVEARSASDPAISLAFLGLAWLVAHTDLRIAAARAGGRPVDADAASGERDWLDADAQDAVFLLGSIVFHAWAIALGLHTLSEAGVTPTWPIPAALALASAAIGVSGAPLLRVLRGPPAGALERLSALLLVMAGALLILAGALAFGAWMEACAGLALGGAAVIAGARLRSAGVRMYGVIALALASARTLFEHWTTPDAPVMLGGLAFTRWSAMLGVAALLWFVTARLVLAVRGRSGAPVCAAAAAGLALVFAAAPHTRSEATWVCAAWLGASGLCALLHVAQARMRLREIACAGLAATVVAWVVAHKPMAWPQSASPVLLHPGLWMALAISAAGAVIGRALRRDADDSARAVGAIAIVYGAGLAFVASSLEIARSVATLTSDPTSRAAAVSVWWGLLGAAMIGAGFWRAAPIVRHLGLALIIAALGKAVAYDLREVGQAARVVTFLGLGLLMLAVALGYARLSLRLTRSPSRTAP